MLARVSRSALLSLVGVPLVLFSCGDENRKFVETPDGSAGTAGSAGTGGSGGSGGSSGSLNDSGPDSPVDGGTRCTQPSDCDNKEACDGIETCTNGFCHAGTPLENGTTCTPLIGSIIADAGTDSGARDGSADGSTDAGPRDGSPEAAAPPTYICANGSCLAKCSGDGECNDNNVCTGIEICSRKTNTCESGTPLACNDSNACTEDKCDSAKGCYNPTIDGDGDGHSPTSLGACGDDCNDGDKTIYGTAPELCDGKDNDCNNKIDDNVVTPNWYVDCDKDGFAPFGASPVSNCKTPAAPTTSCSPLTGGWTTTPPAPGTTDCWDRDPKARPYSADENNNAWQSTSIAGFPNAAYDDDWNCDQSEEKRYTLVVDSQASCTSGIIGTGGFGGISALSAERSTAATGGFGGTIIVKPLCFGSNGWLGATPNCGDTGTWNSCGYDSVQGACVRSYISGTPQQCR